MRLLNSNEVIMTAGGNIGYDLMPAPVSSPDVTPVFPIVPPIFQIPADSPLRPTEFTPVVALR